MRQTTGGNRKRANVALWVIQALLAALFLFAGGVKLVLPVEMLKGPVPLPGLFLRFIGLAEALGAFGLILPGLLRIRTGLTPLAATGHLIIMIGAVTVTLIGGPASGALVPFVAGLLSAVVAYGRWRVVPLAARRRVAPAAPSSDMRIELSSPRVSDFAQA